MGKFLRIDTPSAAKDTTRWGDGRRCARAFLAMLLALTLCTSVVLTGCAADSDAASEESQLTYVSPYDWENNLSVEGDRYVYSEDGEAKSLIGIDVSDHQGNINWAVVVQDGIDFAMLRIGNRGSTEGQLYEDSLFADNVVGAQAAGMPIGVYFFSQAVDEDEAREEAEFVLQVLAENGLDPESLAYPVVFDQEPVEGSEGRANDLTAEQYTANALAFCQVIEEAGYRPMIYGNQNDLAQRDLEQLEAYPIWYAEYHTETPGAMFDFVMWQYSNAGTVRGIDTEVDLNIYMVDERKGSYE